ncbi:hypothetical protein MG290_14725 (plasmid) [Flavobacterium sp. CBA20B-1]|uniref:hypothetical protein n=1 Tax=unclassified Flavobacterium TaxID=196869 RepID=UPI0022252521|nr:MULTISPECIES: hypothetical protein [unclassified Flavobacterium]WCM43616.1 hypothetical protein MG290_14725 [Flavobacterium sp. CBA20B-1]
MADNSEFKHTKQFTERKEALKVLEKAKKLEGNLISSGHKWSRIDSKTIILKSKK